MPNIEIHGSGHLTADFEVKIKSIALNIRDKIFALFANKPYLKEIVVTIYPDEVVDWGMNQRPFLRVFLDYYGNDESEIIELLKTLHMDVEIQELNAFCPKKENSG